MTQKVKNGNKNIQISGDNLGVVTVIEHHYHNLPPKVVISAPTPDEDRINRDQQYLIKVEIDEWVKISETLKQKPMNHAGAWSALNKHMKVPRYTEIAACEFEKAKKFIQKQKSILRAMKSAPNKDATWRNSRYKAIHTRCKQKNLEGWRIDFMQARYKCVSMKELSDQQIEELYRAVMGK